jgi:protein-S-isoprenylcysteine O-methyltransferase Ste14
VVGEGWLFLSLQLLAYAGGMAIVFDLFVIGYEEPTLQRRFETSYEKYRQTVSRGIPRWPRRERSDSTSGLRSG